MSHKSFVRAIFVRICIRFYTSRPYILLGGVGIFPVNIGNAAAFILEQNVESFIGQPFVRALVKTTTAFPAGGDDVGFCQGFFGPLGVETFVAVRFVGFVGY